MKTQVQHGMILPPEFFNKLNNPTYADDPQNDGEIPIPPQIEFERSRAVAEETAILAALTAETNRALAAEQAIIQSQVLSSGVNAVAIHATSAAYLSAQQSSLRSVQFGSKVWSLQVDLHFNYAGSDWSNSYGPSWAIQVPTGLDTVLGRLWNALTDLSTVAGDEVSIPFGSFNLSDQSFATPILPGGRLSVAAGSGFGSGFNGLKFYAISNGTWATTMSGKIDLFGTGMIILP